MSLRQKTLKLLNVYYSDDIPDDEVQKDLDRRGKVDFRGEIKILFLIIKEIDKLKETKSKK